LTKRGYRRRAGLLPPRRSRPSKPLEERYGHVLDSTLDEIMPRHRTAPVDEPTLPADHLLKKADLIQNLEALFQAALARSGALNSDDDFPDYSALAEEANLSVAEYEAVAMSIDGWELQDIAKFQGVSLDAAGSARRRGLTKIRQFTLISTATVFGGSVLRGHFGGDET